MPINTEKIKNPLQLLFRLRLNRLVRKGLIIGKNVMIDYDVIIDEDFPWLVSIGDNCTLGHHVVILAHDSSIGQRLKHNILGRVIIDANTFIGAGSIILPNVHIGKNVIIGAGSVVTRDIPDDCVAIGSPAAVIKKIEQLQMKHQINVKVAPIFIEKEFSKEDKQKMQQILSGKIGYSIPKKFQN
jgi:maltose O-acetyltransferase